MKLSKNKIKHLLKVKNQSQKKLKKTAQRLRGVKKTVGRHRSVNLRNKTLKTQSYTGGAGKTDADYLRDKGNLKEQVTGDLSDFIQLNTNLTYTSIGRLQTIGNSIKTDLGKYLVLTKQNLTADEARELMTNTGKSLTLRKLIDTWNTTILAIKRLKNTQKLSKDVVEKKKVQMIKEKTNAFINELRAAFTAIAGLKDVYESAQAPQPLSRREREQKKEDIAVEAAFAELEGDEEAEAGEEQEPVPVPAPVPAAPAENAEPLTEAEEAELASGLTDVETKVQQANEALKNTLEGKTAALKYCAETEKDKQTIADIIQVMEVKEESPGTEAEKLKAVEETVNELSQKPCDPLVDIQNHLLIETSKLEEDKGREEPLTDAEYKKVVFIKDYVDKSIKNRENIRNKKKEKTKEIAKLTDLLQEIFELNNAYNLRLAKAQVPEAQAQVEQAQVPEAQAQVEQAQVEQAQVPEAQVEQAQVEQAQVEQAQVEQAQVEQAQEEDDEDEEVQEEQAQVPEAQAQAQEASEAAQLTISKEKKTEIAALREEIISLQTNNPDILVDKLKYGEIEEAVNNWAYTPDDEELAKFKEFKDYLREQVKEAGQNVFGDAAAAEFEKFEEAINETQEGFDQLPKADLPKADLPKADLPKADLPKADLPKADLPKADLPGSELPDVFTNDKGAPYPPPPPPPPPPHHLLFPEEDKNKLTPAEIEKIVRDRMTELEEKYQKDKAKEAVLMTKYEGIIQNMKDEDRLKYQNFIEGVRTQWNNTIQAQEKEREAERTILYDLLSKNDTTIEALEQELKEKQTALEQNQEADTDTIKNLRTGIDAIRKNLREKTDELIKTTEKWNKEAEEAAADRRSQIEVLNTQLEDTITQSKVEREKLETILAERNALILKGREDLKKQQEISIKLTERIEELEEDKLNQADLEKWSKMDTTLKENIEKNTAAMAEQELIKKRLEERIDQFKDDPKYSEQVKQSRKQLAELEREIEVKRGADPLQFNNPAYGLQGDNPAYGLQGDNNGPASVKTTTTENSNGVKEILVRIQYPTGITNPGPVLSANYDTSVTTEAAVAGVIGEHAPNTNPFVGGDVAQHTNKKTTRRRKNVYFTKEDFITF